MDGTHLEDLTTRIKPRTASTILLWVIAAFVVTFFVWASFTELDRTVRGQGRVIPSSQLQVVSNLEGGIIQQIMVHSGQSVAAGQELIRLDRTQTGAEFGSGEATVSALTVKIARLEAEVPGREPVYPAAPDALDRGPDPDRALAASLPPRQSPGVIGAATARISQAERAVAEAEASYRARTAAYEERRDEARIIRPLVERGIEPRLSLTQAESARDVALGEMQSAGATVGRAQSGVIEARAQLAQQHQEWRAQAADRARHRPGRNGVAPPRAAGARGPGGPHRAARPARRPHQPRARHHPRRHGRARASRWSRSCRPTKACWSRRG